MPTDFRPHVSVNPTLEFAQATAIGVQLNNEALRLSQGGDLEGAERLHLRAIEVKERGFGRDNIKTALSYNAIGELYTKMGRLDKAEEYLDKAVKIRNASTSDADEFDAAVSRENLAIVHEMRGNLRRAKELRRVGSPNKMLCAYYHCPNQTLKRSNLSQCGGCKSIYYCTRPCQTKDWKRHKQFCKHD